MKKLLALLAFTTILVFGYASSVKADGEIILYPYDQEACLNADAACTRTKVGDSHWDAIYNGYLYNAVGGNVRYVSEFSDDNFDGFITADEMTSNSWASFGGFIFNNTASEVELKTQNARGDLSSVVQRIYTYWDENGELVMFEDHYVTKYYIFNDGTTEAPDWRLATQAEADAYDAADPKPDTTMYTTIRIKLDDVDTDGYVLEPLTSLQWYAQGVDTVNDPVADWSSIIDGDPNNVVIPAGWTVFGFGSLDRDGSNAKTVDFIKTLVGTMAAGTAAPIEFVYDDQPAWFTGLTAEDDDAVTPGVNIVVDYNGTFDLPNTVNAQWVNMFDDTDDSLIHETEMLDYSVVISQDGVDLETINFVWDGMAYVPSAAQTVIDSSVFGSGYTATYMVTSPAGDLTEVAVDIVIGVMPPRFVGIEDRYINEGLFIDLGEGITANDGYGNDETDLIIITQPEGFNPYNPLPGEYEIQLQFTHHVHFDGVPSSTTIAGTTNPWNASNFNSVTALNVGATSQYAIFTDQAMARAVGWAWGSVMVLVGADGKVDGIYDRYDWSYDTVDGSFIGDSTVFEAWKAALVIEEGGFVIASHGSTISPPLRALTYDAEISYELGVPDFDYDIVTEDSYILKVDDTTAPVALIVNDNYKIVANTFSSANAAILANVVAFDNYDMPEDLAVYVSANGGLLPGAPGTYDVEVTVEDVAGNSTTVAFEVVIVAAPVMYTQAQVNALLDAQQAELEAAIAAAIADQDVLTQAEIDALIAAAIADQDLLTQEEVQTLIDDAIADALADTGCGSSLSLGSALVLTIAALGGAVVFFVRKPH